MKEKEEERRKFREDTDLAAKQVIKTKPLYKLKEEVYRDTIEMPELQQKKKQLEELRKFYKPIE